MKKKIEGFNDTMAWYDANAQMYASATERFADLDLIDRFVEAIGKKGKVLDAGCAAGRDSKLLKERGMEPIGVDLSKPLLEIAKKNHPTIKFVCANFLKLPFENETFSGVWSQASLLHIETAEEVSAVLEEFHRVLKQDGVIHVLVKQQQGNKKSAVVSDELSGHDRFFQWFTENELKMLLTKASFEVEKIEDNYKDLSGREGVKWVVALARKK